jgi:alpha-L-rhamnosidase
MFKKYLLLLFVVNFSAICLNGQFSIEKTLCENAVNPLGIENLQPNFTWKMRAVGRATRQTAYEIRVATTLDGLHHEKSLSWSTGKILSDQSTYVSYAGEPLKTAGKYFWQVRAWDNHGNIAPWSKPAFWQMGLLKTADWKAAWIQPGYPEDTLARPAALMRTRFSTDKQVKAATLFITAHGLYEAYINGRRVGSAWLTPGFTSYSKRLQYQVYDVTSYLKKGENATGVMLGNGWYRGYFGYEGKKNLFGSSLALLYQLHITYADGTTEQIVSDQNWKSGESEIRSTEIYNGETIDARYKKTGWCGAGYNAQAWSGVKTVDFDNRNLVTTINEPVTQHEGFTPARQFTTPFGERVIDFGQNLVGFVKVKVKGKPGDTIIIYHAEVLDKAGNFYTENLRTARQKNTYILSGGEEEFFEPHFTFQGFRFIKIEGTQSAIEGAVFGAVALYSDMESTGNFRSSNLLLNQLQHNIQWGQKGNFLDIPTDCPQRDERLGWTGDAQVFFRTAAYNMQVNNFFRKWMKDVAAEQLPNGSVTYVVPNLFGPEASGSTGWADVATIIPWNMYLVYGDKRIIEDQYPSMQAWVNYMQQNSKDDLWNTGSHFGDWLSYWTANTNDDRVALTDKYLIAQCFYAYSTQLMINAASILKRGSDIEKYTALLKRIKTAFLREYVTANGRLTSSAQTGYILALNFDMLPDTLRPVAARRLVENIKEYNYHLTTGFLGTPYLCHVLTRFGYQDVAFTLLMQDTYPSWLYPVKMGATTIWERWDGQKPDSSFQSVGMNSFNHYAYGAIGDWMYRVVAGIDTDSSVNGVGYRKIIIKPYPDAEVIKTSGNAMPGTEPQKGAPALPVNKSLDAVSASLETNYGRINSSWKTGNGRFTLDVEIPVNTNADIYLPTAVSEIITEGGKPLVAGGNGIQKIERHTNYTVVTTGSGKYSFITQKN